MVNSWQFMLKKHELSRINHEFFINIFVDSRHVQVTFQRFHVGFEGFTPLVGHAAEGAGFLAFEGLLHVDVASRGEFVELHAQVASRGTRLLFDVGKFGFLHTDEQGDNREAQF